MPPFLFVNLTHRMSQYSPARGAFMGGHYPAPSAARESKVSPARLKEAMTAWAAGESTPAACDTALQYVQVNAIWPFLSSTSEDGKRLSGKVEHGKFGKIKTKGTQN